MPYCVFYSKFQTSAEIAINNKEAATYHFLLKKDMCLTAMNGS